MRDKIRALQNQSSRLEPSPDQRREMADLTWASTESMFARAATARTYDPDPGRQGLDASLITEDPVPLEALLREFDEEVDSAGIRLTTGGHLGYIPGGGVYPAALGDYLAACSNRYSGVAFACPGAAEMEHALVRWMCNLAGYPKQAGGDLTSGGSAATLSALVAARDAHGIDHETIPQACLYLTDQAHHCIGSALHVAGLSAVQRRIVPMDSRHRMDTTFLRRLVESDRASGRKPWLVIGSAGTTDTGAVDTAGQLADICSEYGLWFHLDAAYGGFFLLCEEGRAVLGEVQRADSIVMDPHKGLGLPFGSGAVLVRNRRHLADSYRYYADYMQDAIRSERDEDAPYSPADYSLELSRHFRGPRMWLPLRLFGLKPFRAALAEKMWLARYFHREVGKLPGFEAGPSPDLSIATFRYLPRDGDAESSNRRLLKAIHDDGQVFITSTRLNGQFTLRMAALSFRTHLEHIDYLLELLINKAAALN